MTKSKTLAVPLRKLYAAFSTPRARARWLPGVKLTVRTATPEKTMRLRWDDSTAVDVYFMSRRRTPRSRRPQISLFPSHSV